MGRWWWMDAMAAGLALVTLLAFIVWPVIARLWGPGARQTAETALQRLQVLLAAASVCLLAVAAGIPLAAGRF